ncbi:MAG: nucleotidyl transferase AbiEii/AbiGii toxin family protein [Selenomonas massiliensis]
MNENEKLMMKVMAELTKAKAPIIFKGAMNLNLALQEAPPVKVHRITHDIDGDWLGANHTVETMRDVLEKAVHRVDPSLSVVVFREPAEEKSTGFRILDADKERVFKVDFGQRSHPFYQDYQIIYQGKPLYIRGATRSKMLSDKICAIASPKVFRRAKDLVDVYILSHSKDVNLLDVHRTIHAGGRTLGSFEEFRTRQEDLKHAYEKLANVENKPDFSALYGRLETFLAPFIEKKLRPLTWTGEAWAAPQRHAAGTKNMGR